MKLNLATNKNIGYIFRRKTYLSLIFSFIFMPTPLAKHINRSMNMGKTDTREQHILQLFETLFKNLRANLTLLVNRKFIP